MRKYLFFTLFLFFFVHPQVNAQTISNINIGPSLDVSYFDDYIISADVSDYGSTNPVILRLDPLNGEDSTYWGYDAVGVGNTRDLTFDMSYLSGTTWQKTSVRPDFFYPKIYFSPTTITWNYPPINRVNRRNSYDILHLKNNFTMIGDMSFWVEINAMPIAANSADMQVYLVKKDKVLSYFNSDWRLGIGTSDVELVGTINRTAQLNHVHNANSGHHLITLTTNTDGTIGNNHIDISGDFWLIIYNLSPNVNRGWNLRYHDQSLCNYSDRWYTGNQTGWTTTSQSGCPDVHFHLARRGSIRDGVTINITANSVTQSKSFYYEPIPNLAPVPGRFTNPIGGAHSDNLDITWYPASDANDDTLTYKIYLLDSTGTEVQTLSTGTTATALSFDTNTVANGFYGLKGEVCDEEPLCVFFNTSSNFYINNSATEFFSISSSSLSSNNSTPTTAISGNRVTLTFTASGLITNPSAVFYSAGYPITNSVTITNVSGNTWEASFLVNSSDTNGEVTFVLTSPSLSADYYQTTDGSFVSINNPIATPTPTPTNISTSNTSVSSGNISAPQCLDKKPVNKPDLFQINVSGTEARLFYTPIQGITSGYYLAYGHESQKPIYGALINQGESTGVLSFDVNHLKPNTVYYFQIRGQNGCMPGDWSNEMRVKTAPNNNKGISFYKNFKSRLTSLFPRKITQVSELVSQKTNNSDECKYVVEKGDSLWLIAQKIFNNGNSYKMIVEQNNLTSTIIYPGQVLNSSCNN